MRNFSAVAVVVLASCVVPATYARSVSTISNPTTYPMGYDTWRCGNTSGRLVLTFDDNPGQYGYDSVLTMGSYLKSRSIRAMFFLTTKDMVEAKRMDVIAKLRKMGHYVGNHSYDHADFYKLSDANFKRELAEGVAGNILRPPFGSYTSHQKELARQLGMRICTWHARLSTHDWDIVNPAPGSAVLWTVSGSLCKMPPPPLNLLAGAA